MTRQQAAPLPTWGGHSVSHREASGPNSLLPTFCLSRHFAKQTLSQNKWVWQLQSVWRLPGEAFGGLGDKYRSAANQTLIVKA